MTNIYPQLLKPFAYIYVILCKLRIKTFTRDIEFGYLPTGYSRVRYPVMLDGTWLHKGMLGLGVFNIPQGDPSGRFDESSIWWQSWIGQYHIVCLRKKIFKDKIEEVKYIANSGLQDQISWLGNFHLKNPKVQLVEDSIKPVKTVDIEGLGSMDIYYGEIETTSDDCGEDRRTPFLLRYVADNMGRFFSRSRSIDSGLRLDEERSLKEILKLKGYWGFIRLSDRRFIVAYASVRDDSQLDVTSMLLRCVESIKPVEYL